ncbi:Rsa3p SCDLUD_001908 [Saccharomycodes ludwigii]|uniref:Rsa3p n=1 Tax=Saccharomycodes ludwigii TaxID=36035 RepID=UPI001E8292D5|nr:hypothetical protein SCDLUD_001908 [Saccharomycodes ludwigii]KAH3902095.1 hypothetical protein SCDLUD_001908 [Saccharomycodes ludwigii]
MNTQELQYDKLTIKNNNNKKNNRNRKKKKRRTAAVSSSSESDSSESDSSNENENGNAIVSKGEEDVQLTDNEDEQQAIIPLSNKQESLYNEGLTLETKKKLISVNLNNININKNGINGNRIGNSTVTEEDLNKISEDLDTLDEKTIKNKYLGMIFENYGDDINKLKDVPDFTNRSLVILANTLKEGVKMFDKDNLSTILE